MIRGEEGKVILSCCIHFRLNLGYCLLDGMESCAANWAEALPAQPLDQTIYYMTNVEFRRVPGLFFALVLNQSPCVFYQTIKRTLLGSLEVSQGGFWMDLAASCACISLKLHSINMNRIQEIVWNDIKLLINQCWSWLILSAPRASPCVRACSPKRCLWPSQLLDAKLDSNIFLM